MRPVASWSRPCRRSTSTSTSASPSFAMLGLLFALVPFVAASPVGQQQQQQAQQAQQRRDNPPSTSSLSSSNTRYNSTTPLSFAPDGQWNGIDGEWSTFALRVGSPAQLARVYVSWASHQTWVVLPDGCSAASDPSACATARGGTFNPTTSSTFDEIGIYYLDVDNDLGYKGNAEFGRDVLGLGADASDGPTLNKTLVGAFAVEDFYLGIFGLNPQGSNFTASDTLAQSYMGLLKEHDLIPSLSFGYTAGARYRDSGAGVLASLTLGGYDAARIVENDVSFRLVDNGGSDTVAALKSISTESEDGSNPIPVGLLPSTIHVNLDATVPQIWLPLEVCKAFEKQFGLVYDNATELYLVNDTLHTSLQQRNPNITFSLSPAAGGGSGEVSITLPYAAFDLTIQTPYPGLTQNSRYFPLRRATSANQYTFGRTFFQEAYISVDWSSNRFNLSQVAWNATGTQDLVAIGVKSSSATAPTSTPSSGTYTPDGSLTLGAKIGIAVGAIAAVVIFALLAVFLWRVCGARKKPTRPAPQRLESDSDSSGRLQKSEKQPAMEMHTPVKSGSDTATSTRRSSARYDHRTVLPSISESLATGTPSTTRTASPHTYGLGHERSSANVSRPPAHRSSLPQPASMAAVGESLASSASSRSLSRKHSPPEAEQIAKNRAQTLSALSAAPRATGGSGSSAKDPQTAAGLGADHSNHGGPPEIHVQTHGQRLSQPRIHSPSTVVDGSYVEPEKVLLRRSTAVSSGDSTLFGGAGRDLSARYSLAHSPITERSSVAGSDIEPVSPINTPRSSLRPGGLAHTHSRTFSFE